MRGVTNLKSLGLQTRQESVSWEAVLGGTKYVLEIKTKRYKAKRNVSARPRCCSFSDN